MRYPRLTTISIFDCYFASYQPGSSERSGYRLADAAQRARFKVRLRARRFTQPLLGVNDSEGPADPVTLHGVAAERTQRVEGRLVLDAFGNDDEPHVVRELDRRAHDDRVVRIVRQCRHERPVDLELV